MTAANRTRILQPSTCWPSSSTMSFANHTVDANNDGVGFVFNPLSTDPITHIGVRWGARSGTPPTLVAGLQSVSTTTSAPTGTYLQNAGNDCKVTVSPPADTTWDGLWKWFALDYSYTPTMGVAIAGVILGGTTDASNYSTITTGIENMSPSRINFPYATRLTGGTWSSSLGTARPSVFGWRTAGGRFGNIVQSVYSTRSASTVGHRVAMKVNLPAGFGDTYKVLGVRFVGSLSSAASKAPLCKIWSASSALASVTLDVDQQATVAGSTHMTGEYYFESVPALSFGTDYYFGLEVADAANGGVIIHGTEVAETADLANQDGGNVCCLSTYNGSTWTDNTLVRPWMELILDDWTEPSGGGGIIMPARSRVFSPMGSY